MTSCITVWFGNCTVGDRKSLQRIVRTAEKIIEMFTSLLVLLLWAELPQRSADSKPNDLCSSDAFTVKSGGVITGTVSSSVVLPCWLDPPLDVTDWEVFWYRKTITNTVLLYQHGRISQDEKYFNRSSLSIREPTSAGLKVGDISLKLENLNLLDEGTFTCFVTGETYGASDVTLNLTALGLSPVISVEQNNDMLNVSCRTCGWFPQPCVDWSFDKKPTLLSQGVVYTPDKNKLTCVHSWVRVSPSKVGQASCSLSVPAAEQKDSTVDIRAIARMAEDTGAGVWKTLFAVALVAVLAIICAGVFYRKFKTGEISFQTQFIDEYMPVPKDEEAQNTGSGTINMEELKNHAVRITLNLTNVSPYLKLTPDGSRVRDNFPENYREHGFPYTLCICGVNEFTSGRAYWEVGLKSAHSQAKTSWLIGVTTDPHLSQLSNNKTDLTPSKGYWFLCSDGENGFHVNTEPEICFSVDPRPEIVGVLLDYEKGELSFYNANEGLKLFTMKTRFQGAIVPLFNPGIGEEAPLTINSNINTVIQGNSPPNPTESASVEDKTSNQENNASQSA
ncbi:butyrophilin subfamily 1 member A1-like [Hoplias malabaricus]|uniref:butyrophilin subfamily 1 member A1-like n=1 Tax=Hoplias malabaricus TaxID=27720 RepID=UPI0034630E6F